MIKSKLFRDYLRELSRKYRIEELSADEIANYVVGLTEDPENKQYLADIINGPIDADKLDYIIRDSDSSGVPLAIGIDRLLLSLGVEEIETKKGQYKKLIVTEKGITPLEQLIFAKIMLFSSIYHHQKVRALDAMVNSIMMIIKEEKISINGYEINSPCDFLRLDDADILKLSKGNIKDIESDKLGSKIIELCNNLKTRKTFKRSLVISPKTVLDNFPESIDDDTDDPKNDLSSKKFRALTKYAEYPRNMRQLNKLLAGLIADANCTEYDVAFDFPTTPSLGVSSDKIIKVGPNKFKAMKNIFPEKGWLDSYMANKWMGHVFANEEFREKARDAGKYLLNEKFDIKLNEDAEIIAKITKFRPSVKASYKKNRKTTFKLLRKGMRKK